MLQQTVLHRSLIYSPVHHERHKASAAPASKKESGIRLVKAGLSHTGHPGQICTVHRAHAKWGFSCAAVAPIVNHSAWINLGLLRHGQQRVAAAARVCLQQSTQSTAHGYLGTCLGAWWARIPGRRGLVLCQVGERGSEARTRSSRRSMCCVEAGETRERASSRPEM